MPAHRSTRPLTAAVAGLVLLAGCSGGDAPQPPVASPTTAAPTGSPGIDTASTTAAALDELLARRDAAVLDGDRDAFRATVADPSGADGRAQLAAFDAARALRPERLAHDVVAPVDDPSAVDVGVRYRLAGLDRGDRTARTRYDLVRDGDRWLVASESPVADVQAPPWTAMPGLTVRRTAHAVVAGTLTSTDLDAAGRTVDDALPGLTERWSRTPGRVLVLAPATVAEGEALLGAPADGGVGASTDGPTGDDGRATGDRVVLDPAAHARLTRTGRAVVLTHELAHVAVRATLPGALPTWLSEGYADHVGYAGANVPVADLLAPLTTAVRAGAAPRDLPDAAAFADSGGSLEVTYLAAWQAVELLADRGGEKGLDRLLRVCASRDGEQAAERACDAALPEVTGLDRQALTRQWRQRLDDLAR
ncbi:hypothetical protein KMZ32_03025 [Phycicoccus sp. MAQZ13P-2]|uniref:hypothetical protein n=1 Tax=Phycicoccus mangrovi TaxID=2840470 RepID=UPI001BFFEF01|nr:hypothetical protein [Phycicoccus mangrovi]MBT9254748.1 hypothetical protein [Phycicoccus mangrovi]MBT9273047.1 hypothetical protein [Phycicoccus mangrovi]